MQAEKFTLETDSQGHIRGLPTLPPHTSVEVILLFSSPLNSEHKKRKPCSELAGQVIIKDDLLTPVAAEDVWDALQ